jgi:hypothetical protein
MWMMLRVTFLIATMLGAAGCLGSQTEGRATAILDASERPARAHAEALAGDDAPLMRETGVNLLATLGVWYGDRNE